ncbi:class I SAM-dependent methyltransferase [Nocardia cyriacigeorgica]|uniref:class I SAM-dependent methyltransferase n=1 Tax=Nocardia cyriacigeorgica TaxID=135487 RepID=UPI0018933B4E|nr:methyltransferase domain-containing protein [Nocardia cyriacigeorgica]MBF6438376.1 class I SAM-dependent methyltransferase [Nocardia cyriacigeorgica]
MTTVHPASTETATEEFAARMVGVLNDGCTAMMTSIGHQTGLFDTMSTLPGPVTCAELAATAGLDERYVREWLGAMTVSGIVEFDAAAQTYRLPAEHAAVLTRAAGPNNLARFMQVVSMLGEVEPAIAECFRAGGGLSYDNYPRFHQFMAEFSAGTLDAALIDSILPMAPGLTERLHEGIDLADIGCGRGHAINLMAQAFPASRFIGYDFSVEAIEAARAEAAQLGVTNARFEVLDVTELDVTDAFDAITVFDAIHDQAHPATVLANIARALRDDGVFLMVDIQASSHLEDNADLPFGPFLYTVSTMHCMTVSLGLDGDGLGTVWGEQKALSMLADAGFTDVRIHHEEADPLNSYYVAQKG